MPIVVNKKKAKEDITKLDGLAEMKLSIQLDLITTSWYNVNQFFKQSNNAISEELIAWIESDIDILCDDENCKTDEYSDLFQALLELESWSDVVYGKLCKVNNWFVEESAAILKLSNSKLITLIQTGALDYSLDTLRKLQGIGATLSCEYILYYRKYITEMLVSGIMNTELAELLLYREGFSMLDYNEIMASLTLSSVTMNKSLANRICEYQSKQYSECNESILYDAISLCEDEHNAVLTVGHKIKQAGVDDSVINNLIERLPNAYNDLSKVSKHPKIIDTDYNRFLIQTLKDANYISSFTIRNGYIRVNTKKERRL